MISFIILSVLVVAYAGMFAMGFTDFMTGEWYYRLIYLLIFGSATLWLLYQLSIALSQYFALT